MQEHWACLLQWVSWFVVNRDRKHPCLKVLMALIGFSGNSSWQSLHTQPKPCGVDAMPAVGGRSLTRSACDTACHHRSSLVSAFVPFSSSDKAVSAMASTTSSIDELQEDLRGNASGSHMLPVMYPGTPSVVLVSTSLGSIAGMFSGTNGVSGFSPS